MQPLAFVCSQTLSLLTLALLLCDPVGSDQSNKSVSNGLLTDLHNTGVYTHLFLYCLDV